MARGRLGIRLAVARDRRTLTQRSIIVRIERVLVCGGGTTGGGIARTLAAASIDVTILEKNSETLARSLAQIEANLDHEIAHWGLTQGEKKIILSRLRGICELQPFERIDAVVEALPEQLELKQRMLMRLEELCPPGAIFFSNAAALSISELAAKLRQPQRLIGLHFLHPVHTVPVVEVVRGLATSDETYQAACALVELLGKTPVTVFEYPGYITTRCIVPLLNEAMYIVMEGVASAKDVDTAMKLGFQLNQGPLTMADHIGLDTVMAWMESLFAELGESKYRPCPLLRKLVRAGHLGAKSGRGFFTYPDGIHQNGEAL